MITTAEHFVVPPHWEWYIVGYFFLAGIAGGAYVLGTMLRLVGGPSDQGAARLAYYISFPTLLLCPVLLSLDLGQPGRFWHMLFDTSPGGALVFKDWSPISIGSWMLLFFGVFAFVAFMQALVEDRRIRVGLLDRAVAVLDSGAGRLINVVGSLLALFVASYTGVLLSVSNQPVWSDTATLGGLFLVSGLSGAAALVLLLARRRQGAAGAVERIARADAYFVVLEVGLIGALMATVGLSGSFAKLVSGRWAALWILIGLIIAATLVVHSRLPFARRVSPAAVAALTIVGVWVLRTVVIFSAQS